MGAEYDAGLEDLLGLDGITFFIDDEGHYTVKFIVKRVETSSQKPHGLSYSLTLHGEDGERLIGFDNAHPVRPTSGPAGKSKQSHDHRHRLQTVRPYQYQDAATLLADFWEQVDSILKEKGV